MAYGRSLPTIHTTIRESMFNINRITGTAFTTNTTKILHSLVEFGKSIDNTRVMCALCSCIDYNIVKKTYFVPMQSIHIQLMIFVSKDEYVRGPANLSKNIHNQKSHANKHHN